MKTKDIQELYKIKLHSMDTILHQISLMDQVENEQELSEIIHSLLQAIGNYTGADRVYVFDWETDQKDSLSNTFEWCADGVIPEIDNLQAIPVSLMPNWMKRFENKEVIVIDDLEATKYSEPEEYELLKTQEICSLIAVPIYANHQMNGFIGVDNPDLRQNEISITLLSDVGGHLGCVRENLKSTVQLKKAFDEATKRTEIIGRVATFLIGNSMFYIPLTFVNVVRFTIQGMGFSTFAILAGVCEMAARSLVGFCLVPVFGFLPACFASPLAWIFADAFLIPAFFHCMKKLKVLFGETTR